MQIPPEVASRKPCSLTFFSPSPIKPRQLCIAGGASGIGLNTAKAMAAAGAFVTIADLQQEVGATIARELSSQGQKVQFVQVDVVNYEAQVVAFKSAVEFGGGKLDIVVPSAGIIAQNNLFDMAAETVPSLDTSPPEPGFSGVEVNLKGVYYSCYLALYYFRLPVPADATPFKKAIVLLSSAAGYQGYPNSTTYSASKFGVRGILYSLRAKASDQTPKVRINLVAPWFVRTPMLEGRSESDTRTLETVLRIYGLAAIENVVNAVVRLSANEEITGRAVVVMPETVSDLEDDIWGGYGGVVFQDKIGVRMGSILKAMAEAQAEAKERSG
ncbi:NAD(P)-binding protein [Pleomassaria siparia CBS 279.74]|uniref:NAD(P)-binding protein n=1 Tax=Pleomassaria siparia CBS 279.74 TaxID=1314801 RepID=A0A6G1KRR3_9PLEO|nr:NAD(P)-binding protein [Pleomassaria siparia CBS 279.74]